MALSTAWQRVATGWLGLRLGGSHLSPDGGGLSRGAVHRLGAGGYGAAGWLRVCGLVVATCRQTVEAFLAPLSTAWERVATGRRVATGQRWLIPLFLFIFVAKRFDELGVVEFSLRTFASATFEFWIGRIEGILWFKDAWI